MIQSTQKNNNTKEWEEWEDDCCNFARWPVWWTWFATAKSSSVHFLDRLGRCGWDMTDDSAEILFQSFVREATVSSSDTAFWQKVDKDQLRQLQAMLEACMQSQGWFSIPRTTNRTGAVWPRKYKIQFTMNQSRKYSHTEGFDDEGNR